MLEGLGLHSGAHCRVRLLAASSDADTPSPRIVLRDSATSRELPANLEHARSLPRRTRLQAVGWGVETVEHLLAACAGLEAFSAAFAIDGPEVPILDGSAAPFCELLQRQQGEGGAGARHSGSWRALRVFEWRSSPGPSRYRLEPAQEGRIACAICFHRGGIGAQHAGWDVGDREAFLRDVAPARTFGFVDEVRALRGAGLLQGVDEAWAGGREAECSFAVVFADEGPLGELRFANEPARHKLLDLIGDVALLGAPLQGRLVAERPSHASTLTFLRNAIAAGALTYQR